MYELWEMFRHDGRSFSITGGKEKEGHECGECCEGDREPTYEDEIGRIGGHENSRTKRNLISCFKRKGFTDTPMFAA